ncbi:MAG: ABC transporter ATP-binding protein [Clostridium sp.]|nr:ABC transporter ATP-binding protein [Clostridium sp.]
MDIIKINNLTKDYGNKKGIFNVNISIKKGEVFGFLGPNGAGKTTTIRNLMGFIRPDSGTCSILGMDCFKESEKIKEKLGYLAGEIAFFDDLTGIKLLNFLADMKGIKDKRKMNELIERFELDPRGKVKKMSKGMKQKIGIISAFMSDAEVFILDEPTSGLDPLMQNRFVDLVLEEKKKGKTILMSSHIFEEIEKTCDRTAIIRNGKIVAIEDMDSLSKKRNKTYIISLSDKNEVEKIKKDNFNIKNIDGLNVSIVVKNDISEFLKNVSKYKISDMNIKTESLEEIFLHYYGKEDV